MWISLLSGSMSIIIIFGCRNISSREKTKTKKHSHLKALPLQRKTTVTKVIGFSDKCYCCN